MIYISIDPGLEKSAYVIVDGMNYQPRLCDIADNFLLRRELQQFYWRYQSVYPSHPELLLERPICRKYAGSDVSETAIWTGVFIGTWNQFTDGDEPTLYSRQAIKAHWGRKGNDSVIRDALIERFDPNGFESVKHTKDGYRKKNDILVRTYRDGEHKYYRDIGSEWFKGFKDDIWQAYALAVHHIDNERGIKDGRKEI